MKRNPNHNYVENHRYNRVVENRDAQAIIDEQMYDLKAETEYASLSDITEQDLTIYINNILPSENKPTSEPTLRRASLLEEKLKALVGFMVQKGYQAERDNPNTN